MKDPKLGDFQNSICCNPKNPPILSSWWLNQPIWKICASQIGSSPQIGMKIRNIWNHHLDFFVFGEMWFLFCESFVYVKFWHTLKLVKFYQSDAYKTWINFGRLGEVPKGRNTHLSPSAWVLVNSSLQNDVVRMIVFPDPTYKAITLW